MTTTLTLPNTAGMDIEESKQAIRATIRERRAVRNMYPAADWVEPVVEFTRDCATVACYVSLPHEPNTTAALTALADAGKKVLLPKLGPRLTRAWGVFHGLDDLRETAPGRPLEPSGDALPNDVLTTVDAFIIPGLALSTYGERLGQGGGWFDRALKTPGITDRIAQMVFPWEFVVTHLPQSDLDVRIPYGLLPTGPVATSLDSDLR